MSDSAKTPSPLISNRLYDVLKWIAQIFLPALGALYFGLAEIWNLPKAFEVVGTITVLDTFLGVLLGLSSTAYNRSDARFDGHIHVTETDDVKQFQLELDSDPAELDQKREVRFKVESDIPPTKSSVAE